LSDCNTETRLRHVSGFSWLIELDKVEVIDLDLYLMVTIDQIDCDHYNALLYEDLRVYSCARCGTDADEPNYSLVSGRIDYSMSSQKRFKATQHTFNLCILLGPSAQKSCARNPQRRSDVRRAAWLAERDVWLARSRTWRSVSRPRWHTK